MNLSFWQSCKTFWIGWIKLQIYPQENPTIIGGKLTIRKSSIIFLPFHHAEERNQ